MRLREEMKEVKRCKKCLTLNTRPGIVFTEDGICSACINAERKKMIDWKEREKDLQKLFNSFKSQKNKDGYNCIVPVSGGKDSYFQVWKVKELGMNPLCITWACCYPTEEGKKNLENLIRSLDVGHIKITPKPSDYRKKMKEGLIEEGDCCFPCHIGIFERVVELAEKLGISLVIWGEKAREEYGGDGGSAVDIPLLLDGIMNVYLSDYVFWNAGEQVKIAEKLGFRRLKYAPSGAYLDYENVDCAKIVSWHDYFMWLKFGFGRACTQLSIDVRNERMTRDIALEKLKEYEPAKRPSNVKEFIDFIGITEEELEEAERKWSNKEIIEQVIWELKGKEV